MSELKNCPFCGCHAEISKTQLNLSASVLYTVSCINKKTCFHTDFSSFTEETAVKYWNTRPAEDAKDREIERLKEALRKIAYIRGLNPELKATEFSVDAETELKNFYCTMGDIAKIALANAPDINVGTMEEN